MFASSTPRKSLILALAAITMMCVNLTGHGVRAEFDELKLVKVASKNALPVDLKIDTIYYWEDNFSDDQIRQLFSEHDLPMRTGVAERKGIRSISKHRVIGNGMIDCQVLEDNEKITKMLFKNVKVGKKLNKDSKDFPAEFSSFLASATYKIRFLCNDQIRVQTRNQLMGDIANISLKTPAGAFSQLAYDYRSSPLDSGLLDLGVLVSIYDQRDENTMMLEAASFGEWGPDTRFKEKMQNDAPEKLKGLIGRLQKIMQ